MRKMILLLALAILLLTFAKSTSATAVYTLYVPIVTSPRIAVIDCISEGEFLAECADD